MGIRVVVILAMCARAASAGPACVAEAKADTATADATKANEARFVKAVAAHKLKPVTLERIELGPRDIYAPENFQIDKVTTGKSHGADVNAITWLAGSCDGGVGPELAQQGTKIFRMERKPTAGKTTAITICGCPHTHYACGGARVTEQPIGYVLPAGTTFGGVISIAYAADVVTITADRPCTLPPPPP